MAPGSMLWPRLFPPPLLAALDAAGRVPAPVLTASVWPWSCWQLSDLPSLGTASTFFLAWSHKQWVRDGSVCSRTGPGTWQMPLLRVWGCVSRAGRYWVLSILFSWYPCVPLPSLQWTGLWSRPTSPCSSTRASAVALAPGPLCRRMFTMSSWSGAWPGPSPVWSGTPSTAEPSRDHRSAGQLLGWVQGVCSQHAEQGRASGSASVSTGFMSRLRPMGAVAP